MAERKDVYQSLFEITDTIKSFIFYLLKKWWLGLLVVIAVFALGVYYASIQKPKYEADATFVLEEKSSSAGGLAGLASQFGVNLGSLSGSGSFFAGDNILNILKSKKIIQKVLLSQASDSLTSQAPSLAELYSEFTGLKKMWQTKLNSSNFRFNVGTDRVSPIEDSLLNVLYESIIKNNLSTERISKQGTIIKVKVAASNSLFARLMTERLVQAASELYLDIRVGAAQDNIRQLQERADSLLVILNSRSYTAANKQMLDINPGIRSAVVPVEIATRDKSIVAALYTEVVKNLEASKLLLAQQTPIIQLLDRPEFLPKDKRKSRFFYVVVFEMMAMVIYLAVAFVLFFFKGKFKKQKILS